VCAADHNERGVNGAPLRHTRHARPQDASAIRDLIDHYVADGTLLPRTESFIAAHSDHFLVAEDDGRIVGCVHLDEYAPSIAELRSLAVHPDARGRGVGRALVDATEALARQRGCATLFAVSNDEAYFNRFGFAQRHIPELDRERSEVSRYKGVFAKDLGVV
jgi:N-acetylglutamate synthase-like GNAT family acetyltransferase